MKTQVDPSELVEVALYGGRSYFVRSAELHGPRTHLRPYKEDGRKALRPWRAIQQFDPVWIPIHRENIVEVGTPRLAAGWQEREKGAHEKLIKQILATRESVPA